MIEKEIYLYSQTILTNKTFHMEQTKLQMAYEIKTYCPSASLFVLMLLSKQAVKEILNGMTQNEAAKTDNNFYKTQTRQKWNWKSAEQKQLKQRYPN